MKKTLLLFFQVWMMLLSWGLVAQQKLRPDSTKAAEPPPNWNCGSTQMMQNAFAGDPSILDQILQGNSNPNPKGGGNNVLAPPPPPTSPYIIPVVFHVISDPTNPTPVPSYQQIQMQLASLNAAFSNNLNSLNNVPTGPRGVNAQIQFCFAKLRQGSPSAWPTSSVGVIYYSVTNSITTNVDISSNPSLASLTALTSGPFPSNMYLNIYCVPNIATSGATSINAPPTVIGIGTFPWMPVTPLNGIVMRNDCIGNNTYNNFTTMFPPLDKGNILVHEAGHYLGLFHTFETITGSNPATAGGPAGCYGITNPLTDGDLVFDTPPTMINGQIPPGAYNTCNESYFPYSLLADENDQIENFMSYIDDDYMNTFTAKQSQRMWGAVDVAWPSALLSGQRANLVTPANLIATGVNTAPSCGPCLLNCNFTSSIVLSSITCTNAAFQFHQPVLPNYLCANTYTWNFGDGNTSNAINPLHTYVTPPSTFTVSLTVSDGVSSCTSTMGINVPTGVPLIVGQSGATHAVCRGSEQTILIQFPPFAQTAVVTDGTNNYIVNNNFVHNNTFITGIYTYPFTFTITNNASYSLVVPNCGTVSTGVANFTVVDCCANLVTNGDFESGPVAFYSQYVLNPVNPYGGGAAVNFPALTWFPSFVNTYNYTGQFLIIDSAPGYTACGSSGSRRLMVGQAITGFKPNTDYFISVKVNQSGDSIVNPVCPNKFNLRLFDVPATPLLTSTFVPSSMPPNPWIIPGGTGLGGLHVFTFKVTTPGYVNALTSYSLELSEVENSKPYGFDYAVDNLIVAEMNGAVTISPLSSTICSGGSVKLKAYGNCVNLSNYTLVWQPNSSLSCSNCPNPIATPSITTTYTLIAIPPISVPPQPNLTFTTVVHLNAPSITLLTPSSTCYPASYTLVAGNVPTATWQPGGSTSMTLVVTPSVSTTYTVSYYDPVNLCANFNTITINPPAPVSLILGGDSIYCTNAGPAIITATALPTGAGATFTWLPGSLSGSSQTVTPSSSTVYTVLATINGCPASNTFAVRTATNCCPPSTVAAITQTLFASTTISGPGIIVNDITITGNTTFQNGEFLMGPSVKVTVQPGSDFTLRNVHLYACGINMWTGIDVLDGAHIGIINNRGQSSLIEDAVTAINLDNVTPSHWPVPIDANDVTFNRNYVGINVSNVTVPSLNLNIESCVFTSRHLPFTPTSWPLTSVNSPDLRSATTPTNNLQVPYSLQNYLPANLKSPYTYQPGHIGIRVSNMNSLAGAMPSAGVIFGSVKHNRFNLFDKIGTGVDVTDASLSTMNNVFQNMLLYNDGGGNPVGGIGIKQKINSLMNAGLYLNPPVLTFTPDFGNRFWDCYRGIHATNVYEVQLNQAIFRSNQKTNNAMVYAPGKVGVVFATNRFKYDIKNNQFENIDTCIHIPITPGNYQFGPQVTGIYGDNIDIKENYFDLEVSSMLPPGTGYVNRAVIVTMPNAAGLQANPGTGLFIHSNNANRVFRGIAVDGMDTYPTEINGNLISHFDDNVFGLIQHGIELTNTQDNATISTNTLSGLNLNNTLLTLVYCEKNNAGSGGLSPIVICNDLQKAFQGFEFAGNNANTKWFGNFMDTHVNGMLLSGGGIIGQQGNLGSPSDNKWVGGSWGGPNFHTAVDALSDAFFSPLYVNSSFPYDPFNNNGSPFPTTYNFPGNKVFTSGAYDCLLLGIPAPPVFRSAQPGLTQGIDNSGLQTTWHLEMYPNPTTGNISILNSSKTEKLNVRVFDVSGKEILNQDLVTSYYTSQFNINAESGIYLVQVTNSSNEKTFKKIVIAK